MERDERSESMREALRRIGPPVYGVAEAPAFVRGWGGGEEYRDVRVECGTAEGDVEVETATRPPLGGARIVLLNLLSRAVGLGDEEPDLPWTVTIDEREAVVDVAGTPVVFQVVEASTGHWTATATVGERHVLVQGGPAASVDGLALAPLRPPLL